MKKKNPFSEASKERRLLANAKNSGSSKESVKGLENKTLTKSQLIALSSKDAFRLNIAIND